MLKAKVRNLYRRQILIIKIMSRLQQEITAKRTLKRLLRKEFDKIPNWDYDNIQAILTTANYYGLKQFAKELQNDLIT